MRTLIEQLAVYRDDCDAERELQRARRRDDVVKVAEEVTRELGGPDGVRYMPVQPDGALGPACRAAIEAAVNIDEDAALAIAPVLPSDRLPDIRFAVVLRVRKDTSGFALMLDGTDTDVRRGPEIGQLVALAMKAKIRAAYDPPSKK